MFAASGVDATVLEVGLGGRLDATNVVDADVSVVTGVALDHQDVLGADLASIAREKAGIWKAGKPAVIGAGGEPEAVPVLVAEAERRGARPIVAGTDLPPGWTVGLAGEHQRANAACALVALVALNHPRVTEEAAKAAIGETTWPGRFEKIDNILFDGAHNPHGARALAASAPHPGAIVVGVSADKDARGILAPMIRPGTRVVVTQAPSARAMPSHDLLARARELGAEVEAIDEPAAALVRAQELAAGDIVVVFGSLFLVGALRALVRGEATDPEPTQDPAAVRVIR